MTFCPQCDAAVLQILIGNRTWIVDAVPHPAGTYSIRHTSVDGWHYGYRLKSDQPPEAGHKRYRLHIHRKGD